MPEGEGSISLAIYALHFDDIYPVDEGFVTPVVTELLPLRLIRMSQNNTVKWDGAEALCAFVVAFLCGREQRVKRFDRCFKHLDELQDALIAA